MFASLELDEGNKLYEMVAWYTMYQQEHRFLVTKKLLSLKKKTEIW